MIHLEKQDIVQLRSGLSEGLSRIDYTQKEPKIIAEIVKGIPDVVNKIKFISGIQVRTGSVFVHQQPLVKSKAFPEPRAVEIGDLLLLRREDNGGTLRSLQ